MEITIGVRARVVGGDPQPAGLARVGEAPADDLVEAEVAQRVLGPAPQPLLAGQAPGLGARAGRVEGRCSSRPWTRADLLDQVGLARDVVVAVGRAPSPARSVAVGLDSEAEPLQVGDLVGLLDPHPEQALDPGAAQQDARLGRRSRAATSIVPGTSFAPQSSTISREAIRCARMHSSG